MRCMMDPEGVKSQREAKEPDCRTDTAPYSESMCACVHVCVCVCMWVCMCVSCLLCEHFTLTCPVTLREVVRAEGPALGQNAAPLGTGL